ncbi:4,5-DOPA dioxygenase extradiol [Hydrogenispora ethanolica]|uniref:4,5-DOPA dioxygenase extradiol n=1 Tax=Hydrogenispora ethanolica TaxID=1082276 RepID=A0A4R1RAR9_HYDET|nr:4,5-DOPA dioxygenase extradiol [Hydrogenispora ethanolica]TCL62749.1 4,5-DOPA dioxygenase extradiol [Hydrogenispora ethanolica]
MPDLMPVVFIGHGSPLNIVLENGFTASLKGLGEELPEPRAILVISAHWLTEGTRLTSAPRPDQLYDFYGFPEVLYRERYDCPGAPELAGLLKDSGVQSDPRRGLDHAAWAILKHIYPRADRPAAELSLDYRQPPAYHWELGKRLGHLRREGILVIGSGNIVHNLRMADFANMEAEPYDWAADFDRETERLLEQRDDAALVERAAVSKAVPTNEHYLPLLYALGMTGAGEPLRVWHQSFQNKSISMRSLVIGGTGRDRSNCSGEGKRNGGGSVLQ